MIESFRNDRSEIVSDTKYLESYTSSDVAQIDRRHSGGQSPIWCRNQYFIPSGQFHSVLTETMRNRFSADNGKNNQRQRTQTKRTEGPEIRSSHPQTLYEPLPIFMAVGFLVIVVLCACRKQRWQYKRNQRQAIFIKETRMGLVLVKRRIVQCIVRRFLCLQGCEISISPGRVCLITNGFNDECC